MRQQQFPRSEVPGGFPGSLNGPVLITGGAGFIGTNLASRLLETGTPVIVFDNLSRPGVEQNAAWLRRKFGTLVEIQEGDVRDRSELRRAVRHAARVYHFAAQVAVTTSVVDPRMDFEVNASGTLNLLEELLQLPAPVPLVFTSTNKVYGALEDVPLQAGAQRYSPLAEDAAAQGIEETRPLDFHTPYGCSKGAAEQYVLDFARTFGQPAVVFRMSCIYGRHQFGNEDQGWVAHFLIRALQGRPITLYGDGRQVRDILFADDLVNALLLAQEQMPQLSGQAFNIGGGPERTTSLLELMGRIGQLTGDPPQVRFEPWRLGDQRYYVSGIRRFREATGWSPRVSVDQGVAALHRWLRDHRVADQEPVAVGKGVA